MDIGVKHLIALYLCFGLQELEETPTNIVVIRGPIYSQLRSTFSSIIHVVTLFNSSGMCFETLCNIKEENNFNIPKYWH